ncbi:hypothetical protein ADH66_02785 [Acutalibacter muris]|jgi:hypothetical protein|uniref:Uncharacterized protein n=2 Tax=Acutalibacter muris TaxID=1796620 RepID=A0ABM6L2V8_9FIRM|nr:hypothetical protein A4V00_06180 [Hungateiclostridiaceae bacterium KB18]ASB39678.1 hypothetical protein ADH66_02785 [Acutalibacter muris]
MVGMISPVSRSMPMGNVSSIYNYRLVSRAQRQAMPETPVTPVRPAPPVYSEAGGRVTLPWQDTVPGTVLPQAYPAEQAARMRVQYPGEKVVEFPGSGNIGEEGELELPGLGADSAQKAAEEGECQTCKERKYQDGSDDSSVSYQTPTHIDADYAPAAVRGHELEHVAHEQAKAQREDRKVVSQTVALHTDICPECGRVYVSGGTTRTVTKADNTEAPAREEQDGAEK